MLYHLPYSWLHYISATLFVFESDCTCCFRKHDGMKCDKHNGHLPQGPGIAPKPRQRVSLHLGPRNGLGFGASGATAAQWRCIQRGFCKIAAKGGCQQHHSWRWSAGVGLQFVSSIILGAGLLAMVCNSAAFFDVEQRYRLL